MCQISLITEDNHFAQWLSADLRKEIESKTSQVSYRVFSAADSAIDQSDILIFDQSSNWQPVPVFFKNLKQAKPGMFILGLVKNNNASSHDTVLFSGMDDYLERPHSQTEMYQTKKVLRDKILILVRLVELQKKFRNELRRSQIVSRSKAMKAIMQRLP